MRSEKERMISGELYLPGDSELRARAKFAHEKTYKFNETLDKQNGEKILRELFSEFGEGSHIRPRLSVDYGENIVIGKRFFANYDLIMLDVAPITIGNDVMFGPRVSLLTPTHPIDAVVRNTGLEYALPIIIGDNVWLGGGVTVNPGISIGDNTIVGSGSVVTHDLPGNVIAVGNPARILREITDHDRQIWEEERSKHGI